MQTSPNKETQSSVHIASTPQSRLLELERRFKVPVEQLFAAFTNSEALKKWWWPRGLYSDHIELDFKEFCKYFINMKGSDLPGGGGMMGQFEEIIQNKSIVMTDNFADEKGNRISAKAAKMPGVWPDVGYITFDFEAVDKNTSDLKLSQEGIPEEVYKDCVQGWAESFDKLREYLSNREALF